MQRVVVTSSCTSILSVSLPVPLGSGPFVYSEKDWGFVAVKEVEGGNKAPPMVYRASKTLAEKGDFFEISCPFFFFGLSLLHVSCDQLPGISITSTSPSLNGI